MRQKLFTFHEPTLKAFFEQVPALYRKAQATVHEPLPVSATVFREGHDKLGAEVVLVAPDGSKRPPVRMSPYGDVRSTSSSAFGQSASS